MKLVPIVVTVALVAAVAGAVARWWPADNAQPAPAPAGIANFIAAEPGKPAPASTFKDGSGADVTLATFKGQVLVVNLWATWCAPCIEELPSLARLAEATKADGIKVVAISVDRADQATVRKFLDANHADALEAFHDQGMSTVKDMAVKGLPTTIIVDAAGNWRGTLVGPADWASDAAIAMVRGYRAP